MMRIAIMTDTPGWHGRELKRAFKARGIDARYVNFSACGFDLGGTLAGIAGFGGALPDAAFVRAIPGGSFEQVTLRLGLLHALREAGVAVYNDARAIERSVDKSMTSFLLQHAGVPTLPTWVTEDEHAARAVLIRETSAGHRVVMKPLFGAQGTGLRRLSAGDALPPPAQCSGVYYLQRYLDTGEGRWHDFRVFVIGGRPVAAMLRRGKTWISNISQGAAGEAIDLRGELGELAVAATRAIDMDYAGVDLIRSVEGIYYVVEVNSIPAWQGLQRVTQTSIAQQLVDDLLLRRVAQPLRMLGNAS
jgi:tetrahydromethanopterin:alpha-L-glutamate ligase